MHRCTLKAAAAVISALAILVPALATNASETEMGWSKNLYVRNADAGYEVKFGGRIMNDWGWNNADDDLNAAVAGIENGTIFRRARLFTEGTIYHNVFWKFQLDFAGGDADFKDMFIGLKGVPLVERVIVGQQYEPAGLETITSSNYITFLERASVTSLMPERKTGLAVLRGWKEGNVTFGAGVFQSSNDYGDAKGDDYALTGRITYSPINADGGRKLLHVGASASHRQAKDGVFISSTKPENPFAPRFLNTDTLFADEYDLVAGEAAFNTGPFAVQGEYAASRVTNAVAEDSTALGDPILSSYYLEASYFLTGENRSYKHGKHSGIKVKKPFTGQGDGGVGAWQLAARVSKMDMNDGGLQAGEFNVVTLGLNWYLNTNTRIMLNYARTDYTTVGKMDSVTARFHIYF